VGTVAAAAALQERAVKQRAAARASTADGTVRDWPAVARHARSWPAEALITGVAAALLGWVAALFRIISDSPLPTQRLRMSQVGGLFGDAAAKSQYSYLGLFLLAGCFGVLLAHALRSPVPLFLLPVLAGAAPGLVGYLPSFSAFAFPDVVGRWLQSVGSTWGGGVEWIALAYLIVAAVLCHSAIRLARRASGLTDRPARLRPMAVFRRGHPHAAPYVAFGLLLVSFCALAWSTAVVCDVVRFGAQPISGALPDGEVGAFLPYLAALAAICWYTVRAWPASLFFAAFAVVAETVRPQRRLPGLLQTRVMVDAISWFDGLCGVSVVWVALPVLIGALALGLPAARDAVRP
jgi:hypothetical protein